MKLSKALSTLETIVADFGDKLSLKRRQLPFSVTVAGDYSVGLNVCVCVSNSTSSVSVSLESR